MKTGKTTLKCVRNTDSEYSIKIIAKTNSFQIQMRFVFSLRKDPNWFNSWLQYFHALFIRCFEFFHIPMENGTIKSNDILKVWHLQNKISFINIITAKPGNFHNIFFKKGKPYRQFVYTANVKTMWDQHIHFHIQMGNTNIIRFRMLRIIRSIGSKISNLLFRIQNDVCLFCC